MNKSLFTGLMLVAVSEATKLKTSMRSAAHKSEIVEAPTIEPQVMVYEEPDQFEEIAPEFLWDSQQVCESGLEVAYYNLAAMLPVDLYEMPVFERLEPSEVRNLKETINFEATPGDIMQSGLSKMVGTVTKAFLIVPETGDWTFAVNSDDGAVLYIDGDVVVNNDGTHDSAFQKKGKVHLIAGLHQVRVEFYARDEVG
jgi:hypothetical protein